jgi:glycosyltransferase involved in cell wall biosynthesis
MIAEFSDYKDYPTFIRAAQIILSRRKDVLFIAIGGGKNLERCKQLISPVEEGFRFLGERKDVEGLVAQLDIGVLCTFTEGISNSVMEYMAAGKPVVVTDGGGSRELVVNEQTGFLIPPKDANAVAEKIELLLDNHNLAIRLGAAGKRRIIREFSLEQLAARTVTAFKNVILKGTEYPRRLVTEHV